MTREEAEKAFEEAVALLKMAVTSGEMGIFTPVTLKALVRAGDSLLKTMLERDFKEAFISEMVAGAAEPAATPANLFGVGKVGSS